MFAFLVCLPRSALTFDESTVTNSQTLCQVSSTHVKEDIVACKNIACQLCFGFWVLAFGRGAVGVRFWASGVRFRASGVRLQALGVRFRGPGLRVVGVRVSGV